MVKFEFILTDHEAENLMSAVQSQIVQFHTNIQDEMTGKNRKDYIKAYNDLIEYYKNIKIKMKNKQVNKL